MPIAPIIFPVYNNRGCSTEPKEEEYTVLPMWFVIIVVVLLITLVPMSLVELAFLYIIYSIVYILVTYADTKDIITKIIVGAITLILFTIFKLTSI